MSNEGKIKVWRWHVFGNEEMLTATFFKHQPQPSLRVRVLSRIIMGSKWERVECPSYALREEIERREKP